jgi:multidrug resistance efflux pump
VRPPGWVAILLASVLGGAALVAYYGYAEARYVTTDYAFVQAPTAVVAAPVAGTLTALDLPVGAVRRRGAAVAVVRDAAGRDHTVSLPMTGTVTGVFATAGDSVLAGQELGEVAALAKSVVVAEVPEAEAHRLRVGQNADLLLPDDPSPVRATVAHVGRAVAAAAASAGMPGLTTANATQYVPVVLDFRKGGLRVIDGMGAVVRVRVG